jgi:hypothetical protein
MMVQTFHHRDLFPDSEPGFVASFNFTPLISHETIRHTLSSYQRPLVAKRSTTVMSDGLALSTDPLQALGPSLFLSILSFLPHTTLASVPSVCRAWHDHSLAHKSGIWCSACYRAGVEDKIIEERLKREESSARGDTPSAAVPVDWKRVCRSFIQEDKNWRHGRCEENILCGDSSAWRLKVDAEQGVCVVSDIAGKYAFRVRTVHFRQ